jgi:hypothetical protein
MISSPMSSGTAVALAGMPSMMLVMKTLPSISSAMMPVSA